MSSLATTDTTFGQTLWTAGTGNWNTGANWTLGVPNAGSGTAFDAIIENGGTAQLLAPPAGSVRRLRVGRAAGAGNMLVDGVGLAVTENFHLNEGFSGVSSVIVQNGGSVASPTTVIGHTGAGTSNFTVTGTNSLLNSSSLLVGSGGTGVLNIQNNGTVSSTALSINGTSTVNLNGGTLRFNTVSGLNQLNYTAGTVQLAGNRDDVFGGILKSLYGGFVNIPQNKGAIVEGTLTLNGEENFTVSGGSISAASIELGTTTGGYGRLVINNGGSVTSNGTLFANSNPNSNASSILVSGAGSKLTVATSLRVGMNHFGTLTIRDGAVVHVGGDISGNNLSRSVFLNGGTLRFTNAFNLETWLQYDSGTIQVSGNRSVGADQFISALFGGAPTIPTGKGLTVEGTATLLAATTVDGGTLTVNQLANAQHLRLLRGTLNIQNQAVTVAVDGLLGGTIDVGADTFVNVALGVTNQGLVTGDGQLGGAFANAAAGELRGEPGKSLKFTGANNTNAGRINLLGGLVEFTQNLTNNAGGLISGNGSLKTTGLMNQGTMNFAGTANVLGDVTNSAGGKIISAGGGATIFHDDVINDGEIRTSTNGFTIFFGAVSGSGAFTGTGTVNIEGDLTPGNSPAAINFGGDVVLGPDATLALELGGTLAGTEYDQINVPGELTLGGTLEISLINGFTPNAGQTFNILNWGSLTGAFSNIVLPALDGLAWDASQLSAGVLSVAPALNADFNHDGNIDAADLNQWAGDFGVNTLSDADGDGDSDGNDFLTWQWQLGSHSTVTAAFGQVPEPATVVLLIIAAAAFVHRKRLL